MDCLFVLLMFSLLCRKTRPYSSVFALGSNPRNSTTQCCVTVSCSPTMFPHTQFQILYFYYFSLMLVDLVHQVWQELYPMSLLVASVSSTMSWKDGPFPYGVLLAHCQNSINNKCVDFTITFRTYFSMFHLSICFLRFILLKK